MLRDKKIVLNLFQAIDYKVMEEDLENKARDGLLIQKAKFGFVKYLKTDPKELEFSIGIYPKSKSFEGIDSDKVKRYIKQQEEKGWTYAASLNNMQVFYKEKNKAIEEIDKSDQLDNIKSNLKLETISYSLLLFMNIFHLRNLFPLEIYNFYTNTSLFGIILLPLLTFFLLSLAIGNIYNLIRLKDKHKEDEIPHRSLRKVKFKRVIFTLFSLIIAIILVLTIALDSKFSSSLVLMTLVPLILAMVVGFKMRSFFKGKDYDSFLKTFMMILLVGVTVFATASITLSYYIAKEDRSIPPADVFGLKFPDLGYIVDANYTYYDRQGSILMPIMYTYSEHIGHQRLQTEVLVGKNEKLTDFFFEKRIKQMERYYNEHWSAKEYFPDYDEAFFITYKEDDTSKGGQILIRKGNSIVVFSLDKDLRNEKIVTAIDKKMSSIPDTW